MLNVILGKEDLVTFWLKFCSKITEKIEKDEEAKKYYTQKFKNFLLEFSLQLINSFKYTKEQMISINSLAIPVVKKKDGNEEEENEDDDYEIMDEQDELQREVYEKKK